MWEKHPLITLIPLTSPRAPLLIEKVGAPMSGFKPIGDGLEPGQRVPPTLWFRKFQPLWVGALRASKQTFRVVVI